MTATLPITQRLAQSIKQKPMFYGVAFLLLILFVIAGFFVFKPVKTGEKKTEKPPQKNDNTAVKPNEEAAPPQSPPANGSVPQSPPVSNDTPVNVQNQQKVVLDDISKRLVQSFACSQWDTLNPYGPDYCDSKTAVLGNVRGGVLEDMIAKLNTNYDWKTVGAYYLKTVKRKASDDLAATYIIFSDRDLLVSKLKAFGY
jgi:hypothetical protein